VQRLALVGRRRPLLRSFRARKRLFLRSFRARKQKYQRLCSFQAHKLVCQWRHRDPAHQLEGRSGAGTRIQGFPFLPPYRGCLRAPARHHR
jgi:hypothetical protein